MKSKTYYRKANPNRPMTRHFLYLENCDMMIRMKGKMSYSEFVDILIKREFDRRIKREEDKKEKI